MMLMRTDPFRELDRLTQQVLGTAARPVAMPMDAFREGDTLRRRTGPARRGSGVDRPGRRAERADGEGRAPPDRG